MAAPLSEALFHGTDADLKPGDTVEPRNEGRWSAGDGAKAFAARDPRLAAGYGKNVYRVSPIEGDRVTHLWVKQDRRVDTSAVESGRGFKVEGLHSQADEPIKPSTSVPLVHTYNEDYSQSTNGKDFRTCCNVHVSHDAKTNKWTARHSTGSVVGTEKQIMASVQKHHDAHVKAANAQIKAGTAEPVRIPLTGKAR